MQEESEDEDDGVMVVMEFEGEDGEQGFWVGFDGADDDAGYLVEQLLHESSLAFLLGPHSIGRFESAKKRTPDPKDVRKALEAFQGVSLRKR